MHELTKGANMLLPVPAVELRLQVASPVRVTVIRTAGPDQQCVANGVHFEATNSTPGIGFTPSAERTEPGALRIDTTRLSSSESVLVCLSLLESATRFGDVQAPRVSLHTLEGADVAAFTLPDLQAETTVIGVELYWHSSGWKIRAVGQGFAQGWPALCAAYGIADTSVPPSAAPVTATATMASGPEAPTGQPAAPEVPVTPPPVVPVERPMDMYRSNLRQGDSITWFSDESTPAVLVAYVLSLFQVTNDELDHAVEGFARTVDESVLFTALAGPKGAAVTAFPMGERGGPTVNAAVQREWDKTMADLGRGEYSGNAGRSRNAAIARGEVHPEFEGSEVFDYINGADVVAIRSS